MSITFQYGLCAIDFDYNLVLIDSEVRVEGLETMDYLDNLCQKERFTEQGDAITFESEVNINFRLLSIFN